MQLRERQMATPVGGAVTPDQLIGASGANFKRQKFKGNLEKRILIQNVQAF